MNQREKKFDSTTNSSIFHTIRTRNQFRFNKDFSRAAGSTLRVPLGSLTAPSFPALGSRTLSVIYSSISSRFIHSMPSPPLPAKPQKLGSQAKCHSKRGTLHNIVGSGLWKAKASRRSSALSTFDLTLTVITQAPGARARSFHSLMHTL